MRYLRCEVSGGVLIATVVAVGFLCSELFQWFNGVTGADIPMKGPANLVLHSVYRVTWSADGTTLLARSRSIDDSGALLSIHRLGDSQDSRPLQICPFAAPTIDAVLSRDGRNVLMATELGALWWLNNETGETLEVEIPLGAVFVTTATSCDGNWLAAATTDGQVFVWDKDLKGAVALTPSSRRTVDSIIFSSDDRRLMVFGDDGSLQVWDLETRKLIRSHMERGLLLGAVFLDDGKKLLSLCEDNRIEISDAASGTVFWSEPRELKGFTGNPPLSVTEDGRLAAWRNDQCRVVVWDVEHSCVRFEIENPCVVFHVSFSPDGKSLAVAGKESMIRIYDTNTGKQVSQIETSLRCATASGI